MEIERDPPKKIDYSLRLYNHLGNGGLFKKMSRKVSGKLKRIKKSSKKEADFKEKLGETEELKSKRPEYLYSKAELKDFLHHENSTSANNYLRKLEEQKILIQTDKKVQKENGNTVQAWKVDREKLGELIENLDYIQRYRKFFKDRSYGRPEKN